MSTPKPTLTPPEQWAARPVSVQTASAEAQLNKARSATPTAAPTIRAFPTATTPPLSEGQVSPLQPYAGPPIAISSGGSQAYEAVLRSDPNLPRCNEPFRPLGTFHATPLYKSSPYASFICNTGIGDEVAAPFSGMSWQVYKLDGSDLSYAMFVISFGGLTPSELRQTEYTPNPGYWWEGRQMKRVWHVHRDTGVVEFARADF